MKIWHKPVLKDYIIDQFVTEKTKVVFDATLGEGGHSEAFLKKGLKVYATERDKNILSKAKERLGNYPHFYPTLGHFKEIPGNQNFDLILMDLGVSVYHYKEAKSGFSFLDENSLDMRLDHRYKMSAKDVIKNYSEEQLIDLFFRYGEETSSKKIARAIVQYRKTQSIETAFELGKIVEDVKGNRQRLHPATQIFQALRIEVNGELKELEESLRGAISRLNISGYLVVLTYHSLEDRLVKNIFKEYIPKKFNFNKYSDENRVSGSGFKSWNKKVVKASEEEVKENPSARSAKLRAIKRNGGRDESKN